MTALGQDPATFRYSMRPPVRYTAAAQVLHWLTALLIFAILPIAWHMTMLARDDPMRESWYTVHKSIGITVLALSIVRIVWRGLNPPPPLPGTMGRLESAGAVVSHWLLYVILFAMPVSGYLISAAGGHAVNYFGLFELPNVVPQSKDLAQWGARIHILGQWAVYGLIVLHVLATAWHIMMRRDGILDRMLPDQENEIR